jgi:hypothetical protein
LAWRRLAAFGNALVSTGELFGAAGIALLFLSRRMFLRFARSR